MFPDIFHSNDSYIPVLEGIIDDGSLDTQLLYTCEIALRHVLGKRFILVNGETVLNEIYGIASQ